MRLLIFLLSLFLLNFISCEKTFDPIENNCECNSENNSINLVFKYGVNAKNVLNTFDCLFTKDLILDPPINTHLRLSIEDLENISKKMDQIDFFNYPDVFCVQPNSDTVGTIMPYLIYCFYVESNDINKELYWEDSIISPDLDADKLRELVKLIRDIIESKSEYKNLPPARGGYD